MRHLKVAYPAELVNMASKLVLKRVRENTNNGTVRPVQGAGFTEDRRNVFHRNWEACSGVLEQTCKGRHTASHFSGVMEYVISTLSVMNPRWRSLLVRVRVVFFHCTFHPTN